MAMTEGIQVEGKHCMYVCKPMMHVQTDGILMTRWDASCRFLTWWETRLYRWFNVYPADIIPPIEVQNNTVGSAP